MRDKIQDKVMIKDTNFNKELSYNYEKAIEKIKVDQQIYMIAPTLRRLDKGRQIQMNCYDFSSTDNDRVPKYNLHVVDSEDPALLELNTCACLIVPQGKERESVFATEMGRQKLCTQAQASRLIVVLLGHGHIFASMDSVKDDLNAKILELSPAGADVRKIPFLSVGEELGEKALIDLKA
jgi:spermidine synthase